MTVSIKPCPFCGGRDISFVVMHPIYGECGTCGTEGPSASTVKGAILEWNDRYLPPKPRNGKRRA